MLLPPKGNLVRNPGFELGLKSWEVPVTLPVTMYTNVSVIGVYVHSGLGSLLLSSYSSTYLAAVYQDVRVSPGNHYELGFSVAGLGTYPVQLHAEVRWLDEDGDDLGLALAISVPWVGPAQAGSWALHTGMTDEAPLTARRARIAFTAGVPGPGILVDDVAFFKSE